jgi:hypothetical protein
MVIAEACLCIVCLLVRVAGGPAPGARKFGLPARAPSSYSGCRGVAVTCRLKSLSSWSSEAGGGRGSELLLRRPAAQVLSVVGCGGGGEGVCWGATCCGTGFRMLIEELRGLWALVHSGDAAGAGTCGKGVWVVVVVVGCVTVVVCGL